MKKYFLFFLLVIISFNVQSQQKYQYPYQDPSLSIDERVKDLISRMTLQEKALQLFNEAEAIDRLGVPKYNWWNECLHGVARAGKATVFPQAIGMAATFDEDLMFRIATAISDEGRAKHHYFANNDVRAIYTGLTFWTPNINIFRDPRWGRGQETYGEDPFLTGRMAVNFIKGLQGDHPKYLKTIATAKHYAVHSGPEFTRHVDNLFVNDRDLYETYLPAFKASVEEANVQSIMCAYNRFRDQPCCGSDLLLSDILRREYGFNGYVVSDCGAISDFYKKGHHHVVETPSQAWGWSLASGTDLNCEENREFLKDNFEEAIKKGVINIKDINTSLERLFRARFMLGMFDPEDQVPFTKIPMSVVGSPEHLKLSQEAAEKSLVLLKNDGILPLKPTVKKVALIGPNADNFAILIANYNGDPIQPITPLKALRDRLGSKNVYYSPGCPIVPSIYTNHETVKAESLFHIENGKRQIGLKAEYFEGPGFKGSPKITRIDPAIDFYWDRSPINNLLDESFSVRWTGVLVPKKTATYSFGGNVKVKLDGQNIGDKEIKLEAGKQYPIVAELNVAAFWWSSNLQQQFAKLTWVETSRDYNKEALDAAKKADVVVFCGGISADLEGEEMKLEIDGFTHGDRTHINLPQVQEDLLKELHKTGKPVVYVNFSGSAVALNWQEENMPAIIQAFYPGEATGTALTRLLFGEINPSGRLPVTFYKSVDDLPGFLDYQMEGRTYRYYQGKPLYPFGYGLSYTTFNYDNIEIPTSVTKNNDVKVKVKITNTGKRDGNEVVQLYLSNLDAKVPVPIRNLVGFKNVFVKAGQSADVEFTVKADQFSVINDDMIRVIQPGKFLFSIGGCQPDETGKVLQKELVLK